MSNEKYCLFKYDSKVKSTNNATLSASSVISHELPLNDMHANIEDNDDDIDLVIFPSLEFHLWSKNFQFRYFMFYPGD